MIDLTGERFGRLEVLYLTNERKHSNAVWHCGCECGTQKNISSKDLRAGKTRSCGCLQREVALENVHVANAARKRNTHSKRAVVEERLRRGESLKTISESLNMGNKTVATIRDDAGIAPRRQGYVKPPNSVWNSAVEADIRQWWSEGVTTPEMEKRTGISKNAIIGKIHRWKLPSRPSPIRSRTEASPAKPERVGKVSLPVLPSLREPVWTPKIRAPLPDADAIALFIATRGVTHCPTAAVAATTASLPAHDREALARHQQGVIDAYLAKIAPRQKRATEASQRFAAMRR